MAVDVANTRPNARLPANCLARVPDACLDSGQSMPKSRMRFGRAVVRDLDGVAVGKPASAQELPDWGHAAQHLRGCEAQRS